MPIQYEDSTSTRKAIDVTVVPSSAGVTVSGQVQWFDDLYQIPATIVPCVYSDDAAYRVALCRHASGPAIVLVEDDAVPSGYEQIVYLARWRLASASDTCATVTIEVPHRTLVPRIGDDGQPIPLPPPTVHAVSATVVLPAQTAEKTRDRKVRKRVRELRQSARDMKQAGTTYAAMTAAQRQIIGELVALDPTGEVPMAVP
jgi:hypothetical protein